MAVDGFALILPVIVHGDAIEAKPAVVGIQFAACLFQPTVLLFPFHLWSGSADTEIRKKRGTEKEKERDCESGLIMERRTMDGDGSIESAVEEIRVE